VTPSRAISRSPEFAFRLRALRALLRESGLDAMLVSDLSNVRYLCGFTGSNGWLLVRRRSAVFVTDTRYTEQAASEVREASVLIAGQERLSDALLRSGALNGVSLLGFEAEHMSFAAHRVLAKLFKGVKLLPSAEAVETLRMIKSGNELGEMRKAIRITETALQEVIAELQPGVSEQSIAASITYHMRRLGADGDAFNPIVLFGPRTSLVHGTPGAARLKKGQLVLFDIGCRVNGYCSDLTRTFAFGRVPRTLKENYEHVREAQQAARSAVREGVTARSVDMLVREMLAKAGLDRFFGHALGHGLGLDVHESPLISQRNTQPLEAGHVVTIEPGVYIPGEGGIRIEDDVLVLPDGSETLTTFPREWTEL